MKKQRISVIAFALAVLLSASAVMTSCSSDKDNGDGTGSDTAGQKIEQNLPTGDDTTDTAADTAPAPVITEPPANEVDDVPTGNQNPTQDPPVTEDPSSDIPAVEMPDDEEPADTEPDESADTVGALDGFIGQTDSGRFESVQSKNLVLFIDWESVIGEDGVADVAVTVGISHYQLF